MERVVLVQVEASLYLPLWQHRLNCLASLFGWTPVASAFHSNALHDGHETISHLSHGLRILVPESEGNIVKLCLWDGTILSNDSRVYSAYV